MKNTKKWTIIGLLVAAGIIISAISIIHFINYMYWPKGKFIPDENLSDNISVSGRLTRMGDKLYYSYVDRGSAVRHGIFEITQSGSSLKYWDGFKIKGSIAYNLDAFKGNLLINSGMFYIDDISHLNLDTGNIETFSKLKGAKTKKNSYFNYVVSKDKIYLPSPDKIYVSYDGTNTKIAFDKVSDIIADGDIDDPGTTQLYTIDGDSLIYVSKDRRIKEYDLVKRKYVYNIKIKNKELFKKDYLLNYDLFKCGNKIIVTDERDGLTVYNASDNFKKIYTGDDAYYTLATYNNLFFIGAESYLDDESAVKGNLTILDTTTGKTRTIINNKNITDIFVLGDKWVYFVDDENNLNRITRDGKAEEKVFG